MAFLSRGGGKRPGIQMPSRSEDLWAGPGQLLRQVAQIETVRWLELRLAHGLGAKAQSSSHRNTNLKIKHLIKVGVVGFLLHLRLLCFRPGVEKGRIGGLQMGLEPSCQMHSCLLPLFISQASSVSTSRWYVKQGPLLSPKYPL